MIIVEAINRKHHMNRVHFESLCVFHPAGFKESNSERLLYQSNCFCRGKLLGVELRIQKRTGK